jgi:hypothetical protein
MQALSADLKQEWNEHKHLAPVYRGIAITDDGLMLGCGTVLARMR